MPLVFLVDRFYSSTFAYTLAVCMEGDEEAVEEVHQMIFMLDNFLPIEKVVGKQPELFLWPKDLLKPELQINLIVNEQVVCSGVESMNLFEQARRERVEERKRQRRDPESNDWDERMAKEEMLARRITRLLQRVNVPQVDS